MTVIALNKVYLTEGQIAYDLTVSDMPNDFLGIATDVVFEGDFVAANYKGVESGAIINKLPESMRPIQMVKALPEQSKIVFGLTFRAGNLPDISDGVLARFIFEKDVFESVSMKNNVFSVYDGVRKNLDSVKWQAFSNSVKSSDIGDLSHSPKSVSSADPSNLVVQVKSNDQKLNLEDLSSDTDDLEYDLESNWQEAALMDSLNDNYIDDSPLIWLWFLLPLGMIILFVVLVYFILKRGKGKPISADFA